VSAPGFLRAATLVAQKDLRLEWRSLETFSSTAIFTVSVLVVFQFAFGSDSAREIGVARLVPGILWTVLVFAAVVGLSRSMQLERAHETLTALCLAPIDRGAIYSGKLLANLVKLGALILLLLPLTSVLFDVDLAAALPGLAVVLAVHGLGLAELGTLFAGVTARLSRGEALLATLLFPAAVPLLISATRCTAAALEGRSLATVRDWLLASVGFDLLYLFVALLTFELVLEE
jgi:heme exporter protein B